MNSLQRGLTLAIATVGLCACGGGGQSAPVTPATSAGTTGTNQTPLATATLTIRGALGFHTAKGPTTSASSRKPAYVNSGGNDYLDVWVVANGTSYHAVNSSAGPNLNVSNGGVQTVSIPLYSSSSNFIVAYEADQPFGTAGNLLAVGESDTSITAGSAQQVSLTMQMNAQFIGITDDPQDTDQSAILSTATSPGTPFVVGCCNSTPDVFFFAADPTAGFVTSAGVGGIPQPTVISTNLPGVLSQTSSNAGYVYSQCAPNLLQVNLSVANPAWNLASGAAANDGVYPGSAQLYSSGADVTLKGYLQAIESTPMIFGTVWITNGGC